MNNYIVYKHTFPDNKVYIGITNNKPNIRWKNGFGYQNQSNMFNAIVKFGWINIKHEILYNNLTKIQAERLETQLISIYKSNQKEYGYNTYYGINNKFKKNINKTHSEIMKEYYQNPDNREKLRNRNKINKPVLCIETGIVYKSTSEALRQTGCNHISSCCKNQNLTSKGYHWKYANE